MPSTDPAWTPTSALERLRPPWDLGRLELRPWTAADAPALQRMRDGDADVVRFTPIPQPYTLEDARATIVKRDGFWDRGNGASFAIVLRAEDAVVGDVTLSGVGDPTARALELGYVVDAPWRGTGVATEVLTAVRRRAHAVGFRLLLLEIDAENAASIRVGEKAGFLPEGAEGLAAGLGAPGPSEVRLISVAR